ncbi:hypothetical protein GB937_009503 [Aspergillus fischeri]|nr:hypothetical protein GB937_009503 [Aspergillus fischeri]
MQNMDVQKVEPFKYLMGCDSRKLQAGNAMPQIHASKKHTKLVRQICRMFEDGELVVSYKHNNSSI